MLSGFKNALRTIAAACHRCAGLIYFKAGRLERARSHFERVLELRGDDFTSYVHLGRIAYSTGNYAGWRREYEHARRTSPERFARLRHRAEPSEPRAAGTFARQAGQRATWRRLETRGMRVPFEIMAPAADARDDFLGEDERRRFAELPPIRREEIHDTDLDELARRLSS